VSKGKPMACALKRVDVSRIVLTELRRIHSDPSITEFSRFGIELMVDPVARATLYPAPISRKITDAGCFLKVFGPTDCQRAQDVEDIVTAAWNDVKSTQISLAMAIAALAAPGPLPAARSAPAAPTAGSAKKKKKKKNKNKVK
jgi:hypothetical protein